MKKKDLEKVSKQAEEFHSKLTDYWRLWLKEQRGLSDEVITKFKIGFNGKALSIPLYGKDLKYGCIKFRKNPFDVSPSSKYWFTAGATAELYGWEHINDPKPALIICEGEFDRLILETHGIPAVTSTNGVLTFKDEWIDCIQDSSSEIYICFDNDDPGFTGARSLAKKLPKARIVQIPRSEGIKDISEYVVKYGIEKFKELLKEARGLSDIAEELTAKRKEAFQPICIDEIMKTLGLTIKEDSSNKLITFLCQLSAYSGTAQFNISFNAPSSTGKSYIPLEIQSLFPQTDVISIGYCSPTAFFHDVGKYDKDTGVTVVNLQRKILIFLDQPHALLLQHLRPILSHDKFEISIKITDRSKSAGLRTKNLIIRGYPSVIFCTAGLKIDEQESTRFLLLSPEITQEKIRQSIYEKIKKSVDSKTYNLDVESNVDRQSLIERIRAINDEGIEDIKIMNTKKIEDAFLSKKILKSRSARDVGRVISLIKVIALLNLWHRERDGSTITANEEDIDQALELWFSIRESQELNLPPYIYNFYLDVMLPIFSGPGLTLTRQLIMMRHYEIYEKPLPEWQLRKEILPMLETVGLIVQEPDPEDKRKMLIYSPKYRYPDK